jgi:hypothetical protein
MSEPLEALVNLLDEEQRARAICLMVAKLLLDPRSSLVAPETGGLVYLAEWILQGSVEWEEEDPEEEGEGA